MGVVTQTLLFRCSDCCMSPPAVDTMQGLSYMNVPEAVFL